MVLLLFQLVQLVQKKIEVPALARINVVKSTIGNNIIDIRGARILNGESQIIFDGTLGRIILVVPKHLSLIIEDQYCLGEVFSYRPNEIPVDEAVKKGLPIIRVMVKNTVGDVNIIEKEIDLTISAESLSHEIKKYRKEYSKKNNKNNKNNNNGSNDNSNGGTSLLSMKTMFMKNLNSAKQQFYGYSPNKSATSPYPQQGQAPGQAPYPYSMPSPYGVPSQPAGVYGTSNAPYNPAPQSSYSYPYQGYPPQPPQSQQQPPQQGYYPPYQPIATTVPYYGSTSAPASTINLVDPNPVSLGPASSVNYLSNPPPPNGYGSIGPGAQGSISSSNSYSNISLSASAPPAPSSNPSTPPSNAAKTNTSTTTTTTATLSNAPYPPRT